MLSFDIRQLESLAVLVNGALAPDDSVWEDGDAVPIGPVHVTGRLSAAGAGRFYWHGRIAGTAVLSCRRCLTDTSVPVEAEAHLIFADVDDEEAEDPDVYTFGPRDKELDLRPAVRELWVLNAPTFALCKEDCKGYCPDCGVDLNTGICSCPPAGDSRWDTLRKLDSTPSN
ncbi:MAG: YceD family protein [Gemmatimonadaceae bacterium]